MLRTSDTMADSYLTLENKEQGTKRITRKRKKTGEKEKDAMVRRNSIVEIGEDAQRENASSSLRPNILKTHKLHPKLEKEDREERFKDTCPQTKLKVNSDHKHQEQWNAQVRETQPVESDLPPPRSKSKITKLTSQCNLENKIPRETQHRKRTLGCLRRHRPPSTPPPSCGVQIGSFFHRALWLMLVVTAFCGCSAKGLVGRLQNCTGEGQQIQLPPELQRGSPCLSCICQKGVVVCDKPKCSPVEGCYHILFKSKSECCQQCKGCMLGDKEFNHASSWSDGCEHHECQSGVLTNSQVECYVPCKNPLPPPPGKCCPVCPGCMVEGHEVPTRADPCVRCVCSGGSMSCEKRACPVLSCPPSRAKLSHDGCCMVCQGQQMRFPLPGGRCFLYQSLYSSGAELELDPCTTCKCQNGFLSCKRHVCPVLLCPRINQVHEPGTCCPVCRRPQYSYSPCVAYGVQHAHGESWRLDECSTYSCHEGKVLYEVQQCEYKNKPCPYGHTKVQMPGECCPKCVARPGVCTVFGDPHYITFDGLLYNFQGTCKYQLVKDCDGEAFDLKVINDARRSKHFSWTKSLRLQIKGAKIKLGENHRRVKVNRRKVKPPYVKEGVFNITYVGYSISIQTELGVRVLWDGRGYVEVEVSPDWQGKTCGLCGNYNHNRTDDLVTRKGRSVRSVTLMANSWSTGGRRSCSRKTGIAKPRGGPRCSISRASAVKQCEHLNDTVLQQCHSVVPVDKYFQSCLLDMCECKDGQRCDCDALLAYTRQCERAGVHVEGWRSASQCGGLECPRGAMYMSCAPACRPSCKNPTPNPECHMKRCKPGCYCPQPTVLMRGACIDPSECPTKKKRRRRIL